MLAFVAGMSGLELLFVTCAVFGTLLFVVRLIMAFLGGDHGDGGDAQTDAMGHHDFSDSNLSFKALSLHGITSFFMMFGLVGWALVRQGDLAPVWPIAGGTAAGLATVWVMKRIFQMAGRLQSSGTMDLQNAVGQVGTVYLAIHPGQTGKVQIAIQGRLSVLNAMADCQEEIPTGQTVRVARVNADRLVVEKTN